MATKLPDNQLIGGEHSTGVDATTRVHGADGREFGPIQPRHADAAKLRPDPATSETIPQTEVRTEIEDSPRAAQATASPASTPSEPEQPATAPPAATNAASRERAEIARRIAAFRNLQIKLKQDRESYFDETMAHTRDLLSGRAKP